MAIKTGFRAIRIRLHIGIASIFVIIVAALTAVIIWNNQRERECPRCRANPLHGPLRLFFGEKGGHHCIAPANQRRRRHWGGRHAVKLLSIPVVTVSLSKRDSVLVQFQG